jgi:hypothetical protein
VLQDGRSRVQFPEVSLELFINVILSARRLRMFENWVLKRIFEPTRDDVTREWKKLHNKEPIDL